MSSERPNESREVSPASIKTADVQEAVAGVGYTGIEASTPLEVSSYKPLRVWPAVVLIAAIVVSWTLPSLWVSGPSNLWMASAFGPALCSVLVLLWWLTFSRASWIERILGFAGVVATFVLALVLADPSMRGPATFVMTFPLGVFAFAIGATLFGRVPSMPRTWIAVAIAACGFGFSTLVRSVGFWGNFGVELHWRWQPSSEDLILASRGQQSRRSASEITGEELDRFLAQPEWPGFRGVDNTARQHGTQIATNWSTSPPELMWKINVGPGWSSFAVAGDLLFTQEQRGELETVVCYHAETGRELWTATIESRFDDPLGGPGPRATPTLAAGGLFVMGASGQLMRLDPKSGNRVWETDLRKVADRSPPMWGFSSSPLVVGDLVVVYAGGSGDKGTIAMDVETGEVRWSAAAGKDSYASPQLCTIAGEELVLMLTNEGLDMLDASTGTVQLKYDWDHNGYRSLQPQVIYGNSILLPTGMGTGTRRIRVVKSDDQWTAEEVWTSLDLKPDFNDLVVYQGFAYGFDGSMFACIDLENGKRQWKGGRYGKGQVLLLADCGLLVVAGERGEIVLLQADPTGHRELTKIQAIKGKTWNHPVVIGDRLYIRNSQEAACYRLTLAQSDAT